MIRPRALRSGDRIGIVATARKITESELQPAFSLLSDWGFIPVPGKHLYNIHNQFAGSDDERGEDMQRMLDDPHIAAILCARGGYGTVRLIDRLDFSRFRQAPKWIIGYSDVTVLHAHIHALMGVQTLHASMPVNFPDNTKEALLSIKTALTDGKLHYCFPPHPLNRNGKATAVLTGGNLSILCSLSGSPSDADTEGKILFLEDLDEYLYHIDRMMMHLRRSGKLSGLKGLLLGAMSGMHDNETPFGKTPEEIIREAVDAYDFPLCFGFPAGHVADNRALMLGSRVVLSVGDHPELLFVTD